MTKDDVSRLKEQAFDAIYTMVSKSSADPVKFMIYGMGKLIEAAEEDAIKRGEIIPTPDPIPEDCNNPCDICKYAVKSEKDWPCKDCIRGGGSVDYFKL